MYLHLQSPTAAPASGTCPFHFLLPHSSPHAHTAPHLGTPTVAPQFLPNHTAARGSASSAVAPSQKQGKRSSIRIRHPAAAFRCGQKSPGGDARATCIVSNGHQTQACTVSSVRESAGSSGWNPSGGKMVSLRCRLQRGIQPGT